MRNLIEICLVTALFSLSACTPRPSDVPKDAQRNSDIINGTFWSWTRNIENGCAAWMAKKEWAGVIISTNTPCPEDYREGKLGGEGLSYFTVSEHIVFEGYWPWSPEIRSSLYVYDSAGNFIEKLPCPYALSPKQYDVLDTAVKSALEKAVTDGEKRILNRVDERLSNIKDKPYSTNQSGCGDGPERWSKEEALARKDYWTQE